MRPLTFYKVMRPLEDLTKIHKDLVLVYIFCQMYFITPLLIISMFEVIKIIISVFIIFENSVAPFHSCYLHVFYTKTELYEAYWFVLSFHMTIY